ncbi:hypothetical protein [Halalkalibacter okhensis]|uniref:Uncharacterized protein n=1 Tax=Halalkalibacter okhensis TaxID=333138 RepID=A0A0B0IIM0_9BACI|nr:hypothetical protein [Halalkalibacter okhensis]KHF40727.1 hypothetical protein LQ50_08040 [Halalkalibacter okhensis]
MENNKKEFIGVSDVMGMASAVNGKANEFVNGDAISIEDSYSPESYKLAFETLAKHVVGYATAHDNGSLLLSLIMEATELDDETDEGLDAFVLIEQALTKGGIQ